MAPSAARYIFLDPSGRLSPADFARGALVLTGLMVVMLTLSAAVSPGFEGLRYTLVYPYLCVFGKRLHDAGLSAWLWLACVGLHLLLSALAMALLAPLLSPAGFKIIKDIETVMTESGFNAGLQEQVRRREELVRLMGTTTLASFLLASAPLIYWVYRLRGDAGPNRYGPPVSSAGIFS